MVFIQQRLARSQGHVGVQSHHCHQASCWGCVCLVLIHPLLPLIMLATWVAPTLRLQEDFKDRRDVCHHV